jgi:hypothetical protein
MNIAQLRSVGKQTKINSYRLQGSGMRELRAKKVILFVRSLT